MTDQTLRLSRSSLAAQSDLLLWVVIRNSAEQISFRRYEDIMDALLCGNTEALRKALVEAGIGSFDTTSNSYTMTPEDREDLAKALPSVTLHTSMDIYHLLKAATEAFVAVSCSVELEEALKSANTQVLDTGGDLASRLNNSGIDLPAGITAEWWKDYLVQMNGETKDWTLPYLNLVRDKLRGAPLIEDILNQWITRIARQYMKTGDPDPGVENTVTAVPSMQRTSTPNWDKCYGVLRDKLTRPIFIELIWSYWHEEGMLVQTMNALSRRFQNVRGAADQDPLAMLDIDPLRPLNNLLWGYVQDEQFRLTVIRRAYEYNHHYGLTLEGKAVPPLRPADSRSRFLESLHNLLHLVSIYFKQDDDTTVRADAFPVLNALKDLHMLLAEGAHNQYGDLPTRARTEMLMQQWLLARPEFREFLPSRVMIAYPEPWMDRVDAMKKLQGWGEVSVIHFQTLAVFGEQLLLSVRFGNWSNTTVNADQAAVWARFWRSEIQGYIHAYRAVTGVDLSADSTWEQQRALVTTQPSQLLSQRLLGGQLPPMLPAGGTVIGVQSFRERRTARKRVLTD